MQRRVFLLLVVLLCVPAIAQATITIETGTYIFNPDTTGNIVTIRITSVTDGDVYTNSNLRLSINSNVGPAPAVETVFGEAASGLIPAASMAGSVWDNFATGFGTGGIAGPPNGTTTGSNGLETIAGFEINVTAVPTSATGIYATLSIDMTGVVPGHYPLLLSGGPFGDTDVFNGVTPVSVSLVGGAITFVPEPGSMVLGLFAVAALAAVAIRRNRRRRAG